MMNPLFNLLNNNMNTMNNMGMSNPTYNNMNTMNNPVNNMTNLINQFNQFKQNFNGNPEQQVKQLLNSGLMSQQQFNQLSQMAKMFQGILK